jgi:hypothetical protein
MIKVVLLCEKIKSKITIGLGAWISGKITIDGRKITKFITAAFVFVSALAGAYVYTSDRRELPQKGQPPSPSIQSTRVYDLIDRACEDRVREIRGQIERHRRRAECWDEFIRAMK